MQLFFEGKNNKYCKLWVRVYSLRYPACNPHVPYCHLWPVRLYNTIQHYLINDKIFEKNDRKLNVYFPFFLNTLSEIFLILRWTERNMIKVYIGVEGKHPFFLPYFNQSWILRKDFRKIHKCKLSWKPFQLDSRFSMGKERDKKRVGRTEGRKWRS